MTATRSKVRVLRVAAGERVAVVGPSATGKTTLLDLVAGISRPRLGTSRVGGGDLGALSAPPKQPAPTSAPLASPTWCFRH